MTKRDIVRIKCRTTCKKSSLIAKICNDVIKYTFHSHGIMELRPVGEKKKKKNNSIRNIVATT